jgi:hypothetical protein
MCSAGHCICTSATNCGTGFTCLPTGACGCNSDSVCSAGRVCNHTSGRCVCATGQMQCSGACVNLQTDANNCGSCGMACASGQHCTAGVCG